MTAVIEVTPEERVPLAYILAVEIGHARHGTKEHQAIGEGLREVYSSLYEAPDGPVLLEFSPDELYQTGIRLFADASVLEEWWLDHRASLRAIHEPTEYPDVNVGRAIERFFPDAVERPEEWEFDQVRPLFGGLARKVDLAMIEYVPAARALYNKERAEINKRVREEQRHRAAQRATRYPSIARGDMWRRAIRAEALGIGDMARVDLDGIGIVVARTPDGYFAINATCTHMPALSRLSDLSHGKLDIETNCLQCPWHGARYDLTTGFVVRQPYDPEFRREHRIIGNVQAVLDPKKTASDIRVYPARVDAGHVWVNVG